MKLRLKGNSIRLRLTQGELRQFALEGKVEETVEFGPGKRGLVYALEAAENVEALHADYESDRLRVIVPAAIAAAWASSDQVGVESESDGRRISVEKDFACLKPRPGEDESDMFPNPEPC
ncbi:MAG: hypothetical protein AB7F88_03985 [Pyrinomonadaceae bacterium]